MTIASTGRLGLWLVGARGNVAATTALGHAALQEGSCADAGLVTELGEFRQVSWVAPADVVLGGHDVAQIAVRERLRVLAESDGIVPPELVERGADAIMAFEEAIRPGRVHGGDPSSLVGDLQEFRQRHGLDRVVVINLASTEPRTGELPGTESALRAALQQLPASVTYALAAVDAGASYVNFTPSTGATGPVFDALFGERGQVHAGRDGKTGETLLKAALLPMFERRNLRVSSWFGQNILGNGDGATLMDPANRRSKQDSKAGLVAGILGYQPHVHVGIDHVPPLGDWKIAWDHIQFSGFLGTRMSLQLTWQGADSILAAPLVLDLARICDLAVRRGERGLLSALGFFFKDPLGSTQHRLTEQFQELSTFLLGSR